MDGHYQIVKLGNGLAQRVKDKKLYDTVLGKINEYHIDTTRAVGKTFKKMDNTTFRSMRNKDRYIVAYSYPDVYTPSFLYLTRTAGTRSCYFIHQNNMYLVKYRFAEQLYNTDTLLEGYLVAVGEYTYLSINDLILYDNKITSLRKKERLKKLNHILDNQHTPDPILDIAELYLNDHVELTQIRSFLTQYNQDYTACATGIMFIPVDSDTSYYYIHFEDLSEMTVPELKIKTLRDTKIQCELDQHRTICFKLQSTEKPDVYQLYLLDGKTEKYVDIASVPDKDASRLITSFLGKHRYCMVLCNYDMNFARWRPYVRSSRHTPDQIHTVKKK